MSVKIIYFATEVIICYLYVVGKDFFTFVQNITYPRGSDGENNTQCFEVPFVDDEEIEPMEEICGQLTTNDPATIPDNETKILIIDDDGNICTY